MKVRCTGYTQNKEKYFTVGKIYEVKHGSITSDEGHIYNFGTNEKVLRFLAGWYKFKPVNETIVIYSKGDETIALDKATGKMGVAKCSPDDTYDFMTGAQLAFERLTGNAEPQEKEFKPHLIDGYGDHFGNIGELTALRDIVGRPLKVGDTVELYTDDNMLRGERVVVCNNSKAFIMGIEASCNKNGTITGGWKIVKKRDFTEVAHGENVKSIKYVKAEPQPEPQLYNGKVVCVENTEGNKTAYTVGKVYEFKDGQITNDYGRKLPTYRRMTSFEDWQRFTVSKFIELVE